MAIVFGQKIFLMVYLRHCSTSNEYELVQNKHFLFLYLWQNLPYTWLGHFEWKIQIPDIFWNFSSKTFFLHIFLPIPMVWQPQIYNIRNICQCNNNISIKIYLFLFYLVYEHNLAGLFPLLVSPDSVWRQRHGHMLLSISVRLHQKSGCNGKTCS